ncbi:MAG: nitroreductase family protein [Patescibacteria group bacterium]|jgi:nitroreductase
MELELAIKTRRSVRKFKNQPVGRELIEKLTDLANYAPSACNVQGWKFIVVDKQELKDQIVDNGGSILIKNAPVGILVIYDKRTKNLIYQDHIQSGSAAIQNLSLGAADLGLGSCWLCHLPTPKKLRKIFKIPAYYQPIAFIMLGYPETGTKTVPRKYDLKQIMSYNRFSDDWPKEKINPIILLVKRILVKIYYLTPRFIKKILFNNLLDKKFVKKFDN